MTGIDQSSPARRAFMGAEVTMDRIRNDRRRDRRGAFSLIELLVVITIIGLLAGVVSVGVMGQLEKAKVGKAEADLNQIKNALKLYKMDHNKYPRRLEDLEDTAKNSTEPYIEELKQDPWGTDYHYKQTTKGYELMSYGADGKKGGEELEEDIDFSFPKRRR